MAIKPRHRSIANHKVIKMAVWHIKEPHDDVTDGRRMRHDDDMAIAIAFHRAHHPFAHRHGRLALFATPLNPGIAQVCLPTGIGRQLGRHTSGVTPRMQFRQILVTHEFNVQQIGDMPRRLHRPTHRTRNDQRSLRPLTKQNVRKPLRLRMTSRIQTRIRAPLDPSLGIPVCLAMSAQIQNVHETCV